MSTNSARIRALNDQLRLHGIGGSIVVTRGIAGLPEADQVAILRAVKAFDAFDADNDPYGEHDFGSLEVAGHKVFFKIDYYDRGLKFHSPDPADSAVTWRIATVMLADEY